jgi:hypothetical protein
MHARPHETEKNHPLRTQAASKETLCLTRARLPMTEYKMTFLLSWKLRQASRRPRRGNRRLAFRPPYVPFSRTVSCGLS